MAATINNTCCPLTQALSPGEREQPLDIFDEFENRGAKSSREFVKTLGTILPLPAGEGRGEGERGVESRDLIR
jgi:hypothetical protein